MKRLTILRKGIILLVLFMGLAFMRPAAAQNLMADPGFEAGSPNPSWSESSTNFGTPLCTVNFCGFGGGTGPHTDEWWAWFGGIDAYEAGNVSQSVIIPGGTATLSFWLEIPVSSGNALDYLNVKIDGNIVFTALESTPGYAPYAQVVLDVSAFADGSPHLVEFDSEVFGNGLTNFFVDDVELTVTPVIQPIPLNTWSIVIAIGLIAIFTIFRFRNIFNA